METALAGTADVIISGDVDLQSLHEYQGMPILTAFEFLYMLEGS
jgi:predicted nucleic acid-binding protein